MDGGANNDDNYIVRKSKIGWIMPDGNTDWIYQRLTTVIADANDYRYQMDIDGLVDPIQFTRYQAGGLYDWHLDIGPTTQTRKLTLILNLDDPSDYKGGGTEIQTGNIPDALTKDQGAVIVFPCYMLHRGAPVTEGTRNILVAWAGGSHYR
jgi:PKHD-type hydroxylase